jgi:hypothetical protein
MRIMEHVFAILAPVLTLLFAAGIVGCVIVIPLVAIKLFRVLFEDDSEDEKNKALLPHS